MRLSVFLYCNQKNKRYEYGHQIGGMLWKL